MGETHGLSNTKEYRTWISMKERCLNPNHRSYSYYGGRGILVCPEWINSFKKFYEDMGEKPKGLTLDRINNNHSYSKENCRWATYHTQALNKRQYKKRTCKDTPTQIGGISGVHWRVARCDWYVYFRGKYITTTKSYLEACCRRKSAENAYYNGVV